MTASHIYHHHSLSNSLSISNFHGTSIKAQERLNLIAYKTSFLPVRYSTEFLMMPGSGLHAKVAGDCFSSPLSTSFPQRAMGTILRQCRTRRTALVPIRHATLGMQTSATRCVRHFETLELELPLAAIRRLNVVTKSAGTPSALPPAGALRRRLLSCLLNRRWCRSDTAVERCIQVVEPTANVGQEDARVAKQHEHLLAAQHARRPLIKTKLSVTIQVHGEQRPVELPRAFHPLQRPGQP